MALTLVLEQEAETEAACRYAFGPPDTTVGRVVVQKDTGDIEILALSDPSDGPSAQFCLGQALPRLQSFHEEGRFPRRTEWTA